MAWNLYSSVWINALVFRCSVCSLIIEIIHIYQMLHKFVKGPNIFSCLKMIHQWFRYHNTSTTLMVTGKMSGHLIWQDLELEWSNLQRKRNRKFVQKDNTMAYNNADVVFREESLLRTGRGEIQHHQRSLSLLCFLLISPNELKWKCNAPVKQFE